MNLILQDMAVLQNMAVLRSNSFEKVGNKYETIFNRKKCL